MATKKSNRTQVKDIAADAQELTANEADKVKGGVKAGYDLKQNKVTETTTTAATTTTTTTTAKAGYDLKQNKAV